MFQPGGSIRAVLFDAVGTLIRPEPGVAEAYLTAARRLSVDGGLTETEVDRRFRTAFARQEMLDREAGWVTDEARERRRWQDIVAEVFGAGPMHDRLFAALWAHFADAGNWATIDSACEQLAAARDAGLIVGVASNFDARLRRILAETPELRDTENVFVSSEIGLRKPSPKFFQAIERQLGLTPPQLLLVGDDIENDFDAARGVGWKAVIVSKAM